MQFNLNLSMCCENSSVWCSSMCINSKDTSLWFYSSQSWLIANVTWCCVSICVRGQGCSNTAEKDPNNAGAFVIVFSSLVAKYVITQPHLSLLNFPMKSGTHLVELLFFCPPHRNIFPSNLVSAAFRSVSTASQFYNLV